VLKAKWLRTLTLWPIDFIKIVGWDLKDEKDADFPCNDENKKTAFLLNADLINEVMEKADEIAEGKILDEEEKAKN
jgi:hypothetical protein